MTDFVPPQRAPTPPHEGAPYGRLMRSEEIDTVVRVFLRAMTPDPFWNWVQDAKEPLTLAPADPSISYKTLPKLECARSLAHRSFVLAVHKYGELHVVAIPQGPGKPDKIVAATMWLPPRQRINAQNINMMVSCKFFTSIKSNGLKAFKRAALTFEPAVERIVKKAFRDRKMPPPERCAWHLFTAATDPDYQGRGYSRLMFDPVLKRAAEQKAPVHLEASTARSRNLYERYGFEVLQDINVSRGEVNAEGYAVGDPKKDREGVTEWIMIKWNGFGDG